MYEIFGLKVYELATKYLNRSAGVIVDLGANVGLSCLYFMYHFPEATIIALEPHPTHIEIAKRQLSANGFLDRVNLIEAGAWIESTEANLIDKGAASEARVDEDAHGIPIRMVDLFEEVAGVSIDLLKIDIEGSEYAILDDSRFKNLNPKMIMLEWHLLPSQPRDGNWCIQKLKSYGYRILTERTIGPTVGLLWAQREQR